MSDKWENVAKIIKLIGIVASAIMAATKIMMQLQKTLKKAQDEGRDINENELRDSGTITVGCLQKLEADIQAARQVADVGADSDLPRGYSGPSEDVLEKAKAEAREIAGLDDEE